MALVTLTLELSWHSKVQIAEHGCIETALGQLNIGIIQHSSLHCTAVYFSVVQSR